MRFEFEALGNAFIVKAIDLDIKLVKLAQGKHAATLVPVRVSPPWTSPHFDRSDYSVVEAHGTTADVMEVGDLSRQEIKQYKNVIRLFSRRGSRQKGGIVLGPEAEMAAPEPEIRGKRMNRLCKARTRRAR